MFPSRRQIMLTALAAVFAPRAGNSAPIAYVMGPQGARIAFTFILSGKDQVGTLPLNTADLRVDPDNLAASTADVTADVRRARTGLVFATQALKSPQVLDAEAHPLARFTSTSVRLGAAGRISQGARIDGRMTLRGVTRNISFDAALYRPSGSARDDFSTLDIRLKGSLSRAAYGATGFANLVEDRVGIDIAAIITARA